ncbi:hypothetical protein [Nocardia sp. NPDC059239]|uniref:hypothetical protein n=1 Tax=Nocardia sp. NPDC059239 TaxID=3346785 RepID=UPI00369488F7
MKDHGDPLTDGDLVRIDFVGFLANIRARMEHITVSPEEPLGLEDIAELEVWGQLITAGFTSPIVGHMATSAREIIAQGWPRFFDWEISLDRADPLVAIPPHPDHDFSQLRTAKQLLDDEFNRRDSRATALTAGLEPRQACSLFESLLLTYNWLILWLTEPDTDLSTTPPKFLD